VAGRPIRVLVADESRSMRLLVTSLLRDDDRFAVVGDVATGAEVLARAKEADLVVLDLVLADSDAFSVIAQLRAQAQEPSAVIFSSVGPDYLRDQATAQGAAAYFTHETDRGALLDGLAAAVGRAERS
jgi:DNA-binding NarL/FixJ family response regulator